MQFLSALRAGWREAKASPALAMRATRHFAPNSHPEQQRLMYETISDLVPTDEQLGLFDIERLDAVLAMRAHSGILEAIDRGYDVWGRLTLAALSGLGGGTLRDLLIGGERLRF